jgi:tetratricopeptide (TPR) repeat protein
MAYTLMPLADVVAEHRAYISGLGFALLAAWMLSRVPRLNHLTVAAVVLTLGLLTIQRNRVWENDLTLWTDTVKKSPGLARPHLNLGLACQLSNRPDAAIAQYREALAVNPRLSLAHINIAGILAGRGDLDAAESALRRAAELSPSLPDPYLNLAVIALKRRQPEAALELLDRAESLGDSYLVHLNRADALRQLGRYEEANGEQARALELKAR